MGHLIIALFITLGLHCYHRAPLPSRPTQQQKRSIDKAEAHFAVVEASVSVPELPKALNATFPGVGTT